jgi:hypothetical protein
MPESTIHPTDKNAILPQSSTYKISVLLLQRFDNQSTISAVSNSSYQGTTIDQFFLDCPKTHPTTPTSQIVTTITQAIQKT